MAYIWHETDILCTHNNLKRRWGRGGCGVFSKEGAYIPTVHDAPLSCWWLKIPVLKQAQCLQNKSTSWGPNSIDGGAQPAMSMLQDFTVFSLEKRKHVRVREPARRTVIGPRRESHLNHQIQCGTRSSRRKTPVLSIYIFRTVSVVWAGMQEVPCHFFPHFFFSL